MLPKIKIVLVDDHPVVIQGLKMMLEYEEYFQISQTFHDGASLRNFLESGDADVILLDITLPDTSGIELCAEIKKKSPETAVLMLSNRSERSIIMQCLQNGANGYLLKNAQMNELHQCIRDAMAGNIVFCSGVKDIIRKPSQHELTELPQLTRREKEILKLLTEGNTSSTIAKQLFLSPLTVDTHRKNIMHKFQVKNVAELINVAVQNNLV